MPEISETLLEETSELLDGLIPIVQKSIGTLKHDSKSIRQDMIDLEIERQESLLQQVKTLKERIHNCLKLPEFVPFEDSPEHALYRKLSPQRNRSGTASLRVTMPDGEQIRCRYVEDTFYEVIKKLGIERVKDCGIEHKEAPIIVTTRPDGGNTFYKDVNGYYIVTATDTNSKIAILNKIADRLGVSLKIDDLRDELRPFYTSA